MSQKVINVLFIIDSLTVGGAEKQVVSLINNFELSNFNFSLAYLKSNASLLSQIKQERLVNGLFCCAVQKKVDYSAISMLIHHIQNADIDIIICSNTYPLFYAWLAKLMSSRKPRIIDVLHSTELRTHKEKVQMLFYRILYLFTDVLVYVCNNQQMYWRKRFLKAKRDAVIYNGIDTEYFNDIWSQSDKDIFRHKFNFENNDYVVGLCAAMRPEKAHLDLLSAISILSKNGFPIKCLLIGDGPERKNIERAIEEYDIGSLCKITGYLEDVRLAVSSCDTMVLVSHQIETFSLAALEAMSLSKPLIMSNIGGASEQIEHGINGYLFNPGDIKALAEHIKALADKQHSLDVGRRNREVIVKKFSLERMINGYEQLMRNLG